MYRRSWFVAAALLATSLTSVATASHEEPWERPSHGSVVRDLSFAGRGGGFWYTATLEAPYTANLDVSVGLTLRSPGGKPLAAGCFRRETRIDSRPPNELQASVLQRNDLYARGASERRGSERFQLSMGQHYTRVNADYATSHAVYQVGVFCGVHQTDGLWRGRTELWLGPEVRIAAESWGTDGVRMLREDDFTGGKLVKQALPDEGLVGAEAQASGLMTAVARSGLPISAAIEVGSIPMTGYPGPSHVWIEHSNGDYARMVEFTPGTDSIAPKHAMVRTSIERADFAPGKVTFGIDAHLAGFLRSGALGAGPGPYVVAVMAGMDFPACTYGTQVSTGPHGGPVCRT